MGIIVDSSVLIAIERGRFDFAELSRMYVGEAVALSMITASELLHGVHRATTDAIRRRRSDFVEQLLRDFTLVPFDLLIARKLAELSAILGAAGKPLGAHDLIIAATAIARGDKIVSHDARSFPHVPGLSFEII